MANPGRTQNQPMFAPWMTSDGEATSSLSEMNPEGAHTQPVYASGGSGDAPPSLSEMNPGEEPYQPAFAPGGGGDAVSCLSKMNPGEEPCQPVFSPGGGGDARPSSSKMNPSSPTDQPIFECGGSGDASPSSSARAAKLEADEELDNFLRQVEDISSLIKGLASEDPKDQERALRKADILLHEKELQDHEECKVTQDRSQINKIPDREDDGGGDMGQEAFMRMVEKDAKQRSEDRRQRKVESDALRKKGNILFGQKDYAGALYNYNMAIKLIKDSPCLYNNRALTYLRLGIFSSVIEDCDRALELEIYSLRARMYKAKAFFLTGEAEKCRKELESAREILPGHHDVIDEYEQELFNMGGKKNVYDSDQEKVWQAAAKFTGEFSISDSSLLEASRKKSFRSTPKENSSETEEPSSSSH